MPTLEPTSVVMIARLVGFDTTSLNSNLALIEFVRDYLADLGVPADLVYDEKRQKANLYATLGPSDRPGIALCGHTDVVPVDGQDWHTDPFQGVERHARLYGRGTADMKGFIGVCLALAPEMLERELRTPIHLVLTYDEEVGCLGARPLIEHLAAQSIRPKACIVGEPTGMQVVHAHKGKQSLRCRVRGLGGHSALVHRGVNAVEAGAEVVAHLKSMARRFRDEGPFDEGFDPPFTSVHTGTFHGGMALNIIPHECVFEFEFRHLPDTDPEVLIAEVRDYAEQNLRPEMQAVFEKAGFAWERLAEFAGFETPEDAEIIRLAQTFAQTDTGKVSFGTEAGLYQQAGIPSVVCGPGSIEQAHKPNEFITLAQIGMCETFVRRLIEHASGT